MHSHDDVIYMQNKFISNGGHTFVTKTDFRVECCHKSMHPEKRDGYQSSYRVSRFVGLRGGIWQCICAHKTGIIVIQSSTAVCLEHKHCMCPNSKIHLRNADVQTSSHNPASLLFLHTSYYCCYYIRAKPCITTRFGHTQLHDIQYCQFVMLTCLTV